MVKNFLYKTGKTVTWVLAIIIILLGLIFALLQTEHIQQRLARGLEKHLNEALGHDSTAMIQAKHLHGFLPFDIKLDRFSMADTGGIWLKMEDVRFAWNLDLFASHLNIQEISAKRIAVLRQPLPPKGIPEHQPKQEKSFQPEELINVLKYLPYLNLEKLAFEEIFLGQTLLGGRKGRLMLTGHLDKSILELAGSFQAGANNEDPALDSILTKPIDFNINLGQTGPGKISLAALKVTHEIAVLTGKAKADLMASVLAAGFEISIADFALLEPITGMPLTGSGLLKLSADGSFLVPNLEAVIQVAGLESTGFALQDLETKLTINPTILQDGNWKADLINHGEVKGIRQIDAPPLPESNIYWQGNFIAASNSPIIIDKFQLAGEHASLCGEGEFDPKTLSANMNLVAILDDLAVVQKADKQNENGQLVHGKAELSSGIIVHKGGKEIFLDLQGGLSGLKGLPDPAQTLLGDSINLSAKVNIDMEGEELLDVSDISIKARELQMAGDLQVRNTDDDGQGKIENLSGRLRLDLNHLNALSGIIGKPLAGALQVDLDITGTSKNPKVQLALTSDEIDFDRKTIKAIILEVKAANLFEEPLGNFSLRADYLKKSATLASSFHLQGDGLYLHKLQGGFPGGHLDGEIFLDIAETLLAGEIKIQIDAAGLRPWHGQDLDGQLALHLGLTNMENSQQASVELELEDVRADFGNLESLLLEADAVNIFGQLSLNATLLAQDFQKDDYKVRELKLNTGGSLNNLAVRLKAAGSGLAEEFYLMASASFEKNDDIVANIENLQGSFGQEELRLEKPLKIILADEGIKTSELELFFGGAYLKFMAIKNAKEAVLDVDLTLPLELFGRFGGPELKGNVFIKSEISGPMNNLKATLDLSGEGLRYDIPDLNNVPDGSISLWSSLLNNRLNLSFKINNLAKKPVTGQASLPVHFSLDPFEFKIPEDEPLTGKLNMEAQLARIAGWLDLDGQELAGLFSASLELAGNLAKPEVNGSLELVDGLFENVAQGITLKDINLATTITENGIRIEGLTANDGGEGKIEAGGSYSFDTDKFNPFELRADLSTITLLQSDEILATLSGIIKVSGDKKQTWVKSTLLTDHVLVYLPEDGGPDTEVLEYTEINGPEPPGEGNGKAAAFARNIILDVDVTMPDRVFVRGKGLDAEFQGDLKVGGTAELPEVTGQIDVKRGFFDFFGRRFVFQKGIIDFNGAYPPMPSIDFETSVEKEKITAVISLNGPAAKPDIILSSQPELPQDEVLARLLFNRDADQLTPAQAISLAFQLKKLQSGGAGYMDKAQQSLGIDTLDYGGDSMETGTVKMGKYINDNVFLEVERGLNHGSGKVTVKYEMSPNILLETEIDENHNSGVGLKWKNDY